MFSVAMAAATSPSPETAPSTPWWTHQSLSPSDEELSLYHNMPSHLPDLVPMDISEFEFTPTDAQFTCLTSYMCESRFPYLTPLGAYLNYMCREYLNECPAVLPRASPTYCGLVTDTDPNVGCTFLPQQCNPHEMRWLTQAACVQTLAIDDSSKKFFEETGWTLNEPVYLSLSDMSSGCVERLQGCVQEHYPYTSKDSPSGSFCSLMTDFPTCATTNDSCTTQDLSMLTDAACGRTVTETQEQWNISDAFRVALAVTPVRCQHNVENCRQQLKGRFGGIQDFCSLVFYRDSCANQTASETSTEEEWAGLQLAACDQLPSTSTVTTLSTGSPGGAEALVAKTSRVLVVMATLASFASASLFSRF